MGDADYYQKFPLFFLLFALILLLHPGEPGAECSSSLCKKKPLLRGVAGISMPRA